MKSIKNLATPAFSFNFNPAPTRGVAGRNAGERQTGTFFDNRNAFQYNLLVYIKLEISYVY